MHSAYEFDLEERTAVFAEQVLVFVKQIPLNAITDPLVRQLVRSATSIGANYCEANDAESKKDFKHKIAICRKESKETKYWLRMIATAMSDTRNDAALLWRESKELNMVFGAIWRKTRVEK